MEGSTERIDVIKDLVARLGLIAGVLKRTAGKLSPNDLQTLKDQCVLDDAWFDELKTDWQQELNTASYSNSEGCRVVDDSDCQKVATMAYNEALGDVINLTDDLGLITLIKSLKQ